MFALTNQLFKMSLEIKTFKVTLILLSIIIVSYCDNVLVNIQTGIIGPWKQIHVKNREITSNIVKKSFVSKLFFEEEYIADEDEQITSITGLAGLREIEMINIGQVKVPLFQGLRLIKSIKMNSNLLSAINNVSLSSVTPTYIDLSNNYIKQIDKGAFGDLLENLNLDCNDLETFSSDWFKDPESLRSLKLLGNHITTIPQDFNLFSSLWEIHMSHNKISTIEEGSLTQQQFTYIDLSYNNLTELKSEIFTPKSVEIMYLNLRANRLNFLSTNLMNKINISVEITLDLNPWLCPCNDLIRQKWLPKLVLVNKKNSWLDYEADDHAHRKDPFCVFDSIGSKKCIQKVDPESTAFYLNEIEPFDTEVCQDRMK